MGNSGDPDLMNKLEASPKTDQPNIVAVPEDTTIPLWRYTSLSKFLNLVRLGKDHSDGGKGNLVFCRADLLDDEYEGTISDPTIDELKDMSIEELQEYWGKQDPNELDVPPFEALTDSYKEIRADQLRQRIENEREIFTKQMKQITYLNCWRKDLYESSSMWRAYTTPSDGIALKSNFDNFCDCFDSWPGILYIGKVQYTDYDREKMTVDAIGPFFHKRKEFKDESEVRAICTKFSKPRSKNRADDLPPIDGGEVVKPMVDIETLIEKIVIHPEAGSYLSNVLSDYLEQYGLDITIERSSLRN